MNKRPLWYEWENIVKNYYLSKWYDFCDSNYTIRGWEIDLVFKKDWICHFIEVKVVDKVDDIFGYITKNKLKSLEKTIHFYLFSKGLTLDYSLDVVFVKNGSIYQIYDNVFIN